MDEATELREAFVEAYEPYLRRRLGEIVGAPLPASVVEAIAEGRDWLDRELRDLLAQPLPRQRQSPLALFQAACAFPTAALEPLRVEPPERDRAAAEALPGDVYDVAPTTSRLLGDEAWKAHVRWGIAKAEAVAGMVPAPAGQPGPARRAVVALVGTDLMDRSKVEAAARAAGLQLEVWRNPAAVESGLQQGAPSVVFVDLTHPAADDVIPQIAAAGAPIVAYGPHVDDVAMARARSLGAHTVVPRSRFFARLDAYMPAVT